jgi:hypothetical protein
MVTDEDAAPYELVGRRAVDLAQMRGSPSSERNHHAHPRFVLRAHRRRLETAGPGGAKSEFTGHS